VIHSSKILRASPQARCLKANTWPRIHGAAPVRLDSTSLLIVLQLMPQEPAGVLVLVVLLPGENECRTCKKRLSTAREMRGHRNWLDVAGRLVGLVTGIAVLVETVHRALG
jgi:hypothetical protein